MIHIIHFTYINRIFTDNTCITLQYNYQPIVPMRIWILFRPQLVTLGLKKGHGYIGRLISRTFDFQSWSYMLPINMACFGERSQRFSDMSSFQREMREKLGKPSNVVRPYFVKCKLQRSFVMVLHPNHSSMRTFANSIECISTQVAI